MGYVNEADLAKLEAEFAVSRKEKMLAHNMLEKVSRALSEAEAASADASLIDRLDMMQMVLTVPITDPPKKSPLIM